MRHDALIFLEGQDTIRVEVPISGTVLETALPAPLDAYDTDAVVARLREGVGLGSAYSITVLGLPPVWKGRRLLATAELRSARSNSAPVVEG